MGPVELSAVSSLWESFIGSVRHGIIVRVTAGDEERRQLLNVLRAFSNSTGLEHPLMGSTTAMESGDATDPLPIYRAGPIVINGGMFKRSFRERLLTKPLVFFSTEGYVQRAANHCCKACEDNEGGFCAANLLDVARRNVLAYFEKVLIRRDQLP